MLVKLYVFHIWQSKNKYIFIGIKKCTKVFEWLPKTTFDVFVKETTFITSVFYIDDKIEQVGDDQLVSVLYEYSTKSVIYLCRIM